MALRHNTHLRTLDCCENGLTEAFSRNVLLPAVRANTGLRHLVVSVAGDDDSAREAVALVAARTQPE
jgi:hypothetical protein